MKKIYFLFLLCFLVFTSNAQRASNRKFTPLPANAAAARALPASRPTISLPRGGVAGTCTTVNLPPPSGWGGPTNYVFDAKRPIDTGYVTGTNFYDFAAIAQYFNLSTTTNAYISGVLVGFGHAYSSYDSAAVPIEVYDGSSGTPGRLIGSSTLYMKDIMSDVDSNQYSLVKFSPALSMPSSKKFFVSVNMGELSWYYEPADTLSILSSEEDKGTGAWLDYYTSPTATKWGSYKTVLGHDWGLFIHPFVSPTASCDLLPVNITSFTAQPKNSNVLLSWQVAQENNMKQYVIERAGGAALQFKPIGTVTATNSPVAHGYNYTDAGAFSSGSDIYYRLRQVDKDGTTSFGRIVKVSAGSGQEFAVSVVNPFKNVVQLQINAPYAQKLQGGVYDMLGRRLAAAPNQVLNTGKNTITIPAASLPKGVYMLKVTIGNKSYTYKIIN